MQNLHDSKYISWLKVNHPEADFTIFSTEPSLLDFFPDTSPLDATAVFDNFPSSETETEECTSNVISPDDATTPRRENEIGSLTPSSLSSSNVSSKAQVTPPNVLSKYLVQYIPAPREKKTSETRVTGLRVLTSAEGITILKEKEEKKQKEKEEKENESKID